MLDCHASSGKPGQRKRKKSENKKVDGDRERSSSSSEVQGPKKVRRRLPKFRKSQKADYISDDSSISSSEGSIAAREITEDTPSTVLSELEIISDENFEDDRRSHRKGLRNVNAAGPSSVRNTRRGHVGNKRESHEGRSRVRNIAHPSFLANLIKVADKIQEPEAQFNTAKKSSRGKEWTAKHKSETVGQYTGTNSRMPFTPERKTMLRYLIKKKCIHRAKGLVVWTDMVIDGYLTDRTPLSLQNHFRKSILPNIEDIGWLENSDRVKFLALRSDTKRGKTS